MIDEECPLDWAERLQEDAEDRAFRRKVNIAALCAFVVLLIVAAGLLALIGAE